MVCKKCGGTKFYKSNQCVNCKRSYAIEYRKNHPEKVRASVRNCQDKKRFGSPRKKLLGNSCELCGSTKRLSLHHKDGNGRNTLCPNNSKDNLQTLCNDCHIKLHVRKWAKKFDPVFQKKVTELWGLSLREIGRRLGIDHSTVKAIRLQAVKEGGKF
jgi:hypothetical protein